MSKYGSAFSATDTLAKAPGTSHNAGLRTYGNVFDLTVDGGTSQPMKLAELGPGVVLDHVRLDASGDLSGINFTIGDGTTANKFGASTAGPNATQKIIYPPLATKLDPTTGRTEIWLTPSGNMPSTGSLRTVVVASHR